VIDEAASRSRVCQHAPGISSASINKRPPSTELWRIQ
jgi:hypothetical protein